MYTVRNSNTNEQTVFKTKAAMIKSFKNIVKESGKTKYQALQGIYVDRKGERDPYEANHFTL